MIEGHLLVLLPILEHDEIVAVGAFLRAAATVTLVFLQLLAQRLQVTELTNDLSLRTLLRLQRNILP